MSIEIKFPYIEKYAHNAVLWLLHRNEGRLDKIKLLKMVFYADFEKLIETGKPIVGGNYDARTFGPVASELYNDLRKQNDDRPFGEMIDDFNTIIACKDVNTKYLTKKEIIKLDEVFYRLNPLPSKIIKKMTHDLNLYSKNYDENKSIPGNENKESFPIPYEDFFLDAPKDREVIIELIKEHQELESAMKCLSHGFQEKTLRIEHEYVSL